MFQSYRIITTIVTVFSFVLSAAAYAGDEGRGVILKADGEVSIVNKDGEAKPVETANVVVQELDTIVTRKGGKAVVKFSDGALTVIDEKSSLRVEETNWFSHIGGKIYFTFRKVFGEPRQVKTNFSTIGVRGTTFIVFDDENGEGVALQEGELEIESPGEAYEIHRQKEVDDFEAFKQQAQQQKEALKKEFSEYKDKVKKEFIEYKKSFTLMPNKVVRFDGNRVDEGDFDEKISAEFSSFEEEAGDMLKEFREKAKEHRENMKSKEDAE